MCDMAECPANYYNLISNLWSSGLIGNVDGKHKCQDLHFKLLFFSDRTGKLLLQLVPVCLHINRVNAFNS